jgi:hypothetical protein
MSGLFSQQPTQRRDIHEEQNNSARRDLNQTSAPSDSKNIIPKLFGRVNAHDLENEQPPSESSKNIMSKLFGRVSARDLENEQPPSESKNIIPRLLDRVSARDIENEKLPSAFTSHHQEGKPNLSIFEKVDRHSGSTIYLGSGTIHQLEDCIRDCLCKTPPYPDYTHHTHHTSKYNFPHKSLTRASILEDYSYDGIISPYHHLFRSDSDSHHHILHSNSDRHHHHHHYYHHSSPHHSTYNIKPAADLSLDDIRQVNNSLAKCGIPVFSQHDHPYNYNKPHPVGDIISACQQILADPTLHAQRDGAHSAVQHVWDNLHYHSPQTNLYGYASPAVRSVASHLFPNQQPPYSPVTSVASHLFGHPQPSSYNPPPMFGSPQPSSYNPPPMFGSPQPSPYNPPPMFGSPQPSPYNPPPMFGSPQPNPYNPAPTFGTPQQSPPSSASGNVLSRLFGGGGR